jgi:hypothetical protein
VKVTLGPGVRLLPQWRQEAPGRSWTTPAKAYAREHGSAGVLRADGSYVLFYMKGTGLHRKTYPPGMVSVTP